MGYVKLRPEFECEGRGNVRRQGHSPPRFEGSGSREGIGRHAGQAFERRDRININVHAHGSHTSVVMSVTGRDGSQIASYLEYGYFNLRAQRHLPGMYVMSEAKYG